MELWNIVLNVITLAAVGVVSLFLALSRTAVQKAVETSAEEGVRTAIKNINWPQELRQELEKSRGVERQELRFKSYGTLWSRLRPLAIYSKEKLDREAMARLSNSLSEWYFSESGGMLLTSHVREFYFALQDLAHGVGRAPDDWQSERSSDDQKGMFESILKRMDLTDALEVMDRLSQADRADWPVFTTADGRRWRTAAQTLAGRWRELMSASGSRCSSRSAACCAPT